MNEPNSVAGDLLQYTLLGGKRFARHGDHRDQIKPDDFKHLIVTGSFPYDGTTDVSFFDFDVPNHQCLLVNYVSCYTSEQGGTNAAVNYGFNVDIQARWELLINNMVNPVTPYLSSQGYVNSPCLFVFPGGTRPLLTLLNFGGALAVPLFVQMRMNGYLMDDSYQNIFNRYQSLPAAT